MSELAICQGSRASQVVQVIKRPPANAGPLGWKMATHSSMATAPWAVHRVAKSWTQLSTHAPPRKHDCFLRNFPSFSFIFTFHNTLSSPGGSDGNESAFNVGDPGSISESGRFPWRREWLPTPVFLPGEFHGQRSLEGYSP